MQACNRPTLCLNEQKRYKHQIYLFLHRPGGAGAVLTLYCSVSHRYCCKSTIDVRTMVCVSQNLTSSGRRAISVGSSSDTISQRTPHGLRPANRARSTVASVWPSRSKTPLALARKGKMCPGRLKSVATDVGSAMSCTVVERSLVLIPVVIPDGNRNIKKYIE
jgi:hypothetical protein